MHALFHRACVASVCHALQRDSWQHTLWLAYSSLGVIYVRTWVMLLTGSG